MAADRALEEFQGDAVSGKRFVPASTIRERMDRKDLRFQADARRKTAETDAAVQAFRARTSNAALFPPPLITDPDYNARTMAVHFLRRIADGVEHRWRIEPDELQIALNFLYQAEPALRPKDDSL